MKRFLNIAAAIAVTLPAAEAFGHGNPIVVAKTNDDQLIVSGGAQGAVDGFATQLFFESNSDGDPKDFFDPADFGPAIYWDVPGFEISGLAENSGLYLQALARPVKDASPAESRVLWYWNPASAAENKVELAPAGSRMQIRHSATSNALLTPETTVAPPAFRFADPVDDDMGFHNHGLMKYLLPFPLPADGAYAFFAQLTSDEYAPSEPFLVLINNGGLNATQMTEAAAAINAAAVQSQPGDYDHDSDVDAADYVAWRKKPGTDEEYTLWRSHFGAPSGGAGGAEIGNAGTSVPEPGALPFIAIAAAAGFVSRRVRRRNHIGRC